MFGHSSLGRLAAVVLMSLLFGCTGPVTWECTYEQAGVTEIWDEGETPCDAARNSGFQGLNALQDTCTAAVGAACTCGYTDVSRCGGDWND